MVYQKTLELLTKQLAGRINLHPIFGVSGWRVDFCASQQLRFLGGNLYSRAQLDCSQYSFAVDCLSQKLDAYVSID